jgi:hypothetical protein
MSSLFFFFMMTEYALEEVTDSGKPTSLSEYFKRGYVADVDTTFTVNSLVVKQGKRQCNEGEQEDDSIQMQKKPHDWPGNIASAAVKERPAFLGER